MKSSYEERAHVQFAILECLARAPFLRAEDLALELKVGKNRIYAYLQTLLKQRYIESFSRMAQVYALTAAGRATLAQKHPDPQRLVHYWGMQEQRLPRLLPRIDQLLLGHMLLQSLLIHAPLALGERGKPALVRWSWIRDYEQSLPDRGTHKVPRAVRLFADWLVILHVKKPGQQQEVLYPLFVLLDHECLPQQQVRQRLQYLLKARQLAADRDPCALEQFPLVLILLSGWHRARHWQRWAAELVSQERGQGQLPPLRGCLTVASWKETTGSPQETRLRKREKRFLTAPLNMWNVPWQSLQPHGPAEHLRTLVLPYPASAVPGIWLEPSHHGLPMSPSFSTKMRAGAERPGESLKKAPKRWGDLTYRVQHIRANHLDGNKLGLFGLLLKQNQYRLLELLLIHPLLSSAEMAHFLSMQEGTVEQYLATLKPFACLETEHLHGDPRRRWRLSSQGLRLLALRYHMSPLHFASSQETAEEKAPLYIQRGLDKLRREAKRTIGVYTFFSRLARDSVYAQHRLLWWETAYAPEQSFYRLSQPAWNLFSPDATGEYLVGERHVRFWLEWQGNWEKEQRVRDSLRRYASYIQTSEWRREGHVLPVLLLVCPDAVREKQVQQLAREVLGHVQRLMVFSTTAESVNALGPLAPVWDVVSSIHRNRSAPRRTFYDLRAEDTLLDNAIDSR